MRPLEGKVAIVTGGAGQIGTGGVRALADAGASVSIVDVDAGASAAVLAQVRDNRGSAIAISGDVTDRSACASAISRTVEEYGGVDILVNLAQEIRAFMSFVETTDDDMLASWDSGVLGTFRMMQLCYPHLEARGGGAVINFGSGAGTAGGSGFVAYGSAKEGIRLLTKVAALEWGPVGIRVNTICPFAHRPERWETMPELFNDDLLERIPLRRDGDPYRDIGAAIIYLSGPGDFVTGQTLFIDGGCGFYR